MPARSPAQFAAFLAAANGKSRLGIPKRVGREFVRETPEVKRRAFGRALANRRNRHETATKAPAPTRAV